MFTERLLNLAAEKCSNKRLPRKNVRINACCGKVVVALDGFQFLEAETGRDAGKMFGAADRTATPGTSPIDCQF